LDGNYAPKWVSFGRTSTCARTVQILAENRIVASHPRHTAARLVIDPSHYDGLPTDQVIPPPPLGKMGRRLQALAQEPVVHRSIDLYARLAEVAR